MHPEESPLHVLHPGVAFERSSRFNKIGEMGGSNGRHNRILKNAKFLGTLRSIYARVERFEYVWY